MQACRGCGKRLCDNCGDPEYPGFCYVCSLNLRNGTPPSGHARKGRNPRIYVSAKLIGVFATVPVCTAVAGFIFGLGDLLVLTGIVSFVIMLGIGMPASMLIDLMSGSDKGAPFIVKTILHGLAGMFISFFLASNWEWPILAISVLNAIVYYWICLLLQRRFAAMRRR